MTDNDLMPENTRRIEVARDPVESTRWAVRAVHEHEPGAFAETWLGREMTRDCACLFACTLGDHDGLPVRFERT